MLMQRVNLLCAKDSNQPATDNSQLRAALERKKSLIDFRLDDIADAKRVLGMDSEHAQKLDGLVDGLARGRERDHRPSSPRCGTGMRGGRQRTACPTRHAPDRQRRAQSRTATSCRRSTTR